MKRKGNSLIVGTVLVVLVGALIFLQARNVEHPEQEEPPPITTQPGGNFKPAPSVDDALDKGGPAPGPIIAPQ